MTNYRGEVEKFYREHKRMPSFAELMRLWKYRTKSAVDYRVDLLVKEGALRKDETGRLIPRAAIYPMKDEGLKLLGLVEAGFPSPAEEELLDVMSFDEYLTPNKEASYILKVKGDSMIDAGIVEGDMVIVERRGTYKPGHIVIASVDNEYTMKYLRRQKNGEYYLEPANKKYPPIYPRESFRVEAVVTAVVRKY